MKFNEQLICLRKREGWSQEELGFRLDVSRQTVSKWESGETTPEMQKLVSLSEIFDISLDDLAGGKERGIEKKVPLEKRGYEYKSRRCFRGVPLIHVNLGTGFRTARGIIALGNISIGVVSVGALSLGFLSVGGLALGGLAMAMLSAGLISFGGVAVGGVAVGGLAVGHLAVGGLAMGNYAIGGAALAKHIALGGYAEGTIAAGKTAVGSVEFQVSGTFSELNGPDFTAAIHEYFPRLNRLLYRLFNRLVK